MSCSSSGETNCINTASGNSHSVLVAVSCAEKNLCVKLDNYQESFLSDNYELTFSNKKDKQSFPSENYNRARYAHTRATSADSIPPRLL